MALTAISYGHRYPNGAATIAGVLVRCDCGNEKIIPARRLKTQLSCGCARGIKRRGGGATYEKHRMIGTPTYRSWCAMKQRCSDPNQACYSNYGGRGITVCERWHDFRNFFADMGARPDGKTLDRIDPNGHYEPGNCRWATAREQRLNQRP